MRLAKSLLFLVWVQLLATVGFGQKLDPDPNRILTTSLKWERISGAPRSEKGRLADGRLVILYLEGVYAEVSASFIKANEKTPIGLNLNKGFIVRLGTWSRTDDDRLIRIESREVYRDRVANLPGPVSTHTCRLEGPSTVHIADTIVCNGGLVVSHSKEAIDLADLPSIVRRLVDQQQKRESVR